MSLAQLRSRLEFAARDEVESGLSPPPRPPRLPPARLSGPRGDIVGVVPLSNPAAMRLEPSALHREGGAGGKPLKSLARLHRELESEGVIERSAVASAALLLSAHTTVAPQRNIVVIPAGETIKLKKSASSPAVPTTDPTGLASNTSAANSYNQKRNSPLPDIGELKEQAFRHTLGTSAPFAPYSLADASGLRISKRNSPTAGELLTHPGAGRADGILAHLPSNRSDAIRLTSLLDSLLKVEEGGWERQCEVHDMAFAEAILQVGNHCAERGELLQRLRRFYQACIKSEAESRKDLREGLDRLFRTKQATDPPLTPLSPPLASHLCPLSTTSAQRASRPRLTCCIPPRASIRSFAWPLLLTTPAGPSDAMALKPTVFEHILSRVHGGCRRWWSRRGTTRRLSRRCPSRGSDWPICAPRGYASRLHPDTADRPSSDAFGAHV